MHRRVRVCTCVGVGGEDSGVVQVIHTTWGLTCGKIAYPEVFRLCTALNGYRDSHALNSATFEASTHWAGSMLHGLQKKKKSALTSLKLSRLWSAHRRSLAGFMVLGIYFLSIERYLYLFG